ncbi:MAG: hypothetical protein LIO94_06895 [Clostridiales bacterium]|nr:hypothetical protein [Clostridiales bacterium]
MTAVELKKQQIEEAKANYEKYRAGIKVLINSENSEDRSNVESIVLFAKRMHRLARKIDELEEQLGNLEFEEQLEHAMKEG